MKFCFFRMEPKMIFVNSHQPAHRSLRFQLNPNPRHLVQGKPSVDLPVPLHFMHLVFVLQWL